METQAKGMGRIGIIALLGTAALSAAALVLCRTPSQESVTSAGHTWTLPRSSDVSRILLPDGRTFEVAGARQRAYLIDGATRRTLSLPEVRRFASVTVMPSGQVLLWGGIDATGKVLDNGEWFEPTTGRFVRTGTLGLPARAGHTLTVLTDGRLLMTGGWSAEGAPATSAVLWQPQQRLATALLRSADSIRLEAVAQLQPDGSVRINGGVDSRGRAVLTQWSYDPATEPSSASRPAAGSSIHGTAAVAATLPAANANAAPIRGALAIRFTAPVDLHQLNTKTITLLGPEGTVPVKVIGAEGGRLAFVLPPDDLYPGSRYTLFVQGLHAVSGAAVPFKAVGFTTARVMSTGVMVAGQGGRPAVPGTATSPAATLPPLYLMAGGARDFCDGRKSGQLCRSQSFIRDGAWFPGDNNVADATGGHWRLYQPHQSLPDTRALEAALGKGATAVIGQVRQIDEKPVANVEVSIGPIKTRTDARGVFVLKGIPAGRQKMFVDGRSASHDEVNYGRFLVGTDVQSGKVERMPYVMYLPRVLPRDVVALPSPTTREIVVRHPEMPGLELHIPAGTVFKDRDGHVLTHIAIVPTPVDHAPFPLPDNFPVYFTIQPSDAVVEGLTPEAAKGLRIVYPNYGHVAPNTVGNFWVYDAQQGWRIYGTGHITADARQVAPDKGVTVEWLMGASVSLSSANPPNQRKPGGACLSQPVDLQTGIFFHQWNDLAIRDVVPLALTRAYNSADTASHLFGIGSGSNVSMHLYTNNGYVTPQLVLPCGEGVAFNLISGPSPPSGELYGNVWAHNGSNTAFYGATLEFLTAPTERWLLTMKDGTQYGFQNEVPNQLLWMKDRFGNQVQLVYNGGLVEQMISPSGRSITLNYGSGNRVSSIVDNTGRTVSYAYTAAGALTTVTYPDKTTEQYGYTSTNQMQTMQDRRGNVWVTNQYDTQGRVATQTLADGTAYQFGYTLNGSGTVTATTVTDPNGNQEYLTFDPASGYPLTDTHAYGTALAQTTTYIREASGLVDSLTDALGRTTSYAYDGWGNVTRLTRLAGTSDAVSYQFTYTSDYNQLASVTDPLQHTTTLSYTNGCLTGITDPLGHSTTIQCNNAGQPTTIKDALGHVTTLAYQGYDLQSVTDALNRTAQIAVDALGRPTAVKDPLGNVTVTQYDTNDRVVQTLDGLNQTTTISYDGNGNPLSVTLPSQAVVSQTYDVRNRPSTHTDALKQVESWQYDGMGDVLSHTDRKNQLTGWTYDALERPSLVTYADGTTTQATYDAGNRVTQVTDSNAGNQSWGYDDLDRVTTVVAPQGTISYTYDAAGRRTSMTPAAQAIVNYAYDNANRLTSLSQGSETVQFGYDNANRRTSLILPNAISVAYGYDVANELTGMTYLSPTQTTMGTLAYGYDRDGRRTGKTGSFATDLLPANNGQSAAYDLNNRQTQFNGMPQTYDADGNLTNDGTNSYTWNARNQLTQVSQGGSTIFSYAYDAQGRRISKTVTGAGNPTQYLYDGANAVQEAQGSTVNPILTGLSTDERFARNDVTGRTYFLTDALNSTIALTDPTGAIQQQYSYDPYGNVAATGTATGITNPYQYTGREADSASLYYYRARYYSPGMGRFISEDPLGFGGRQLNFYAYVGGSPIDYTDPSGKLIPEAIVAGLIGAAYNVGVGLLSGDCRNQLWADAGAGFATGFVIGLTDGASLLAGAGAFVEGGALDTAAVSGARALFSSGMDATRQLVNSDGASVNWWGVGAAGVGSVAGDWMGAQVSAANALSGQSRSLMQEQVSGAWLGGLVGGSGGAVADEAQKETH